MFRIGIGQDSHKFSKDPAKRLVLGGFVFEDEDEIGLEGNSDGDALLHSLCNALESAIGGNSFSAYADPLCQKGVSDSREYLKIAMKNIEEKGYQINNISVAIEAKKPKIFPFSEKIRGSLSEITGVPPDAIGITATSGEELTSFAKGEGLQVFSFVSLIKKQL